MLAASRILIVGDSGRGKTTFGKKLSAKLGIPSYQSDDFYWKVKFSEPANKQESIESIAKIYAQDRWIVDGSTRHLIQDALEKAHIIYLLEFKSIIPQYYFLIARSLRRKYESWGSLWELLVHVTRKRFQKGYRAHLPSLRDMLRPYEHKVVRLYTLSQIRRELERVGGEN
jgi:adenylate kinase family enzyme